MGGRFNGRFRGSEFTEGGWGWWGVGGGGGGRGGSVLLTCVMRSNRLLKSDKNFRRVQEFVDAVDLLSCPKLPEVAHGNPQLIKYCVNVNTSDKYSHYTSNLTRGRPLLVSHIRSLSPLSHRLSSDISLFLSSHHSLELSQSSSSHFFIYSIYITITI